MTPPSVARQQPTKDVVHQYQATSNLNISQCHITQHQVCHLHPEDLMVAPIGTLICVAVPPGSQDHTFYSNATNPNNAQLPVIIIDGISGVIHANPYQHRIVSNTLLGGMSDLKQLYHNNEGGCLISFNSIDNYTIEVTWKRYFEDMYYDLNQIKIFGKVTTPYCRFHTNFRQYRTLKKLGMLLECLKVFVTGDVTQTVFLSHDYHTQVSALKW